MQIWRKQNCFEKSEGSKKKGRFLVTFNQGSKQMVPIIRRFENRGFENSGFYCMKVGLVLGVTTCNTPHVDIIDPNPKNSHKTI